MAHLIARNCRVEVGTVEAAGAAITSVTNDDPPVLTRNTHGFTNGDVVYLTNVQGMTEMDGQVFRVANVTTNTFEAEGIDSTNYGVFTSGDVVEVTTFSTLAKARTVEAGSVSPNKLDAQVLLDSEKQYVYGATDSPDLTIDGLSDLNSASILKVSAAARTNATLVFRITFVGQSAVRLFRATCTLPSESITVDQLVTSSFSATQVRQRLAYAS